VPFNGLQISAIDYGEVLNKKFEIKYKYGEKLFLQNRKQFLFNELYYNIKNIILNSDKYYDDCEKKKQKTPWDDECYGYNNGLKILMNNHSDFFTKTKNKYIKLYPQLKEWRITDKIIDEFRVLYPKLHSEYFGWCSYHKCNLPKQNVLDIMKITNVDELFNYLIKKIN
jgi:hypothetical protein